MRCTRCQEKHEFGSFDFVIDMNKVVLHISLLAFIRDGNYLLARGAGSMLRVLKSDALVL